MYRGLSSTESDMMHYFVSTVSQHGLKEGEISGVQMVATCNYTTKYNKQLHTGH